MNHRTLDKMNLCTIGFALCKPNYLLLSSPSHCCSERNSTKSQALVWSCSSTVLQNQSLWCI